MTTATHFTPVSRPAPGAVVLRPTRLERQGRPTAVVEPLGAGFPLLVARTLNPDASDRDIGLPAAGNASAPAYLTALARRTRPLLDSTREADRKALLTAVASESGLTAGALLGAQVAQRVAGGRSLDETARLNGPSLHKAIEDALKALESPGS